MKELLLFLFVGIRNTRDNKIKSRKYSRYYAEAGQPVVRPKSAAQRLDNAALQKNRSVASRWRHDKHVVI